MNSEVLIYERVGEKVFARAFGSHPSTRQLVDVLEKNPDLFFLKNDK
jgi:hypothetical protein